MTSRRTNSGPATQSRTGFTMAETLVVLVLLAIVGGSLMNVLTKQQQFYNGTSDLIQMRTQMRQAEAILGGDLRGISSSGGDITTMTDSSIDFNYTIGTSVVCSNPGGGNAVLIPQTGTLTNGNTLTSWITTPLPGDQVALFDEGDTTTKATDDAWRTYSVQSLTPNTGNCDAAFNSPGAGTVAFTGNIKSTILSGAPIHFMRTAHYSLHQFSDGLWYLGYCSPTCGAGVTINPIAGPFRSYAPSSTPDTSGIRMTYYDSTGTVTATASQVARIDITIRGQTTGYVHIQGMTKGVYHDSLSMSIALRNRS